VVDCVCSCRELGAAKRVHQVRADRCTGHPQPGAGAGGRGGAPPRAHPTTGWPRG
jgi:hypothetical protein